jgi:hypothetical protein
MRSLDKAKDLSASSEGPDDLAVARNAPERPDAPVAGASNASAPSSAGDAGLHLQNAHFGALQVKETLTAPTADGGFGPSAAQQNDGVSESPTAPSPQTAMPEATALVSASQDAETPASAPFL